MKSMFESHETFTAYAQIDAAYWAIGEISESDLPTEQKAKETIGCMETIIKAKKVIGADYSDTEKAIKKLKTFI